MKRYPLLTAAAVIALLPVVADAGVLFEKTYWRGRGKPIVETDHFQAAQGPGEMTILNNGVCSAVISLNGEKVLVPIDFVDCPAQLGPRAVQLAAENEVAVELRGAPQASLTVIITQPDREPTVYYLTGDGTELRRVAPNGQDQQVVSNSLPCYLLSISGTGSDAAMACGGGDSTSLWVSSIDDGTSYWLAPARWSNHVSWLPDDTEIGFDVNGDGIYRIAPSGGAATKWIEMTALYSFGNSIRSEMRFSADRTRFVIVVGWGGGGGHVVLAGNIDFSNGMLTDVRQISQSSSGNWDSVAGGVDISADGETVYYSWRIWSQWSTELWRVGFDGSNRQQIWGGDGIGISRVRLSPDGQRVWFTHCDHNSSCSIANVDPDGSDYRVFPTVGPVASFAFGPQR